MRRFLLAGLLLAAVIVVRKLLRGQRRFVQTSVAARNARLVAIGARTGSRQAVHAVRRATVPEERRAELDTAHQMRTAADVAAALGEMKGALMKLGQMASYLDDGIPEPVRDALASLQHDAPPMAPELCAEVVRSELGDVPDRLFAAWDPVP